MARRHTSSNALEPLCALVGVFPLWELRSPSLRAQLPGPTCNCLSSLPQRCQTLLKEYKERDKSNVFVDKRFGEYNSNISLEEKMLKRFALEQQVWQTVGRYLRLPFHAEVKHEKVVSPVLWALAHWAHWVELESCTWSGQAKGDADFCRSQLGGQAARPECVAAPCPRVLPKVLPSPRAGGERADSGM